MQSKWKPDVRHSISYFSPLGIHTKFIGAINGKRLQYTTPYF